MKKATLKKISDQKENPQQKNKQRGLNAPFFKG